jgi:L-fuconolactonase
VQAADSIDDTRHMIESARTNRRVSGVVAWVPIDETKEWTPWATRLAAAAQAPNVVAKLSGLNTAAARDATAADFRPYVEHALDVFGPHRIMYGGDWPFALLAADSYTEIWNGLRGSIDQLDAASRRAVLSGTARHVYGLTTQLPTTPCPPLSRR